MRITPTQQRDLDTYEECQRLVIRFMGDVRKARAWFSTPNYLLGGITPEKMFLIGRTTKLLEIIKSLIEDNTPHERLAI